MFLMPANKCSSYLMTTLHRSQLSDKDIKVTVWYQSSQHRQTTPGAGVHDRSLPHIDVLLPAGVMSNAELADRRGTLQDVQLAVATKGVERAYKLARRSEWGQVADDLISSMEAETEEAFMKALDAACVAVGLTPQPPPKPFSFTYVRVPADAALPVEELTANVFAVGDQLPEIVKDAFAGGSIVNAEGLRAEYGAAVDEKMAALNMVASQGSVEVFALVRPSATTRPVAHAGSYIYLDEMGMLKGLPVNKRAGEIAASCGLVSLSTAHARTPPV